MSYADSLTPYLGDVFTFTIHASDPEASVSFYEKLGFRELMRTEFPFPFIQLTDDAILITLRKSTEPYLGLTYFTSDAAPIVSALEEKGISFFSKPAPGDVVKRFLIQSPDGANVALVEVPRVFSRPTGKTMLNMEQSDYFKPETYTNQYAGMYGEFAESVANLETSISFWQKLGFSVLSKYDTPAPWAILADGLSIVGLHQTKEFSQPSITFFAADMKEKVARLKQQGLSFTDIDPANVILETPEKQKIFLFNMGM